MPSANDRSRDYLNLALYTFAIFAWELVVLITIDVGLKAAGLGDGLASVLHWLITAAGWCGGAWYVLHRRPSDDGLFADPIVGSVARRAVAVAAAIAVCSGLRIASLGEWKPYAEIQNLRVDFGSTTWSGVIALFIYYAAETLVIAVLIAFAQRAGELRFGRRGVPWGGFVLACTWGVMHIFLQGPSAGLYAMFASVLYGVIYSVGPRRLGTHRRPHRARVHRLIPVGQLSPAESRGGGDRLDRWVRALSLFGHVNQPPSVRESRRPGRRGRAATP